MPLRGFNLTEIFTNDALTFYLGAPPHAPTFCATPIELFCQEGYATINSTLNSAIKIALRLRTSINYPRDQINSPDIQHLYQCFTPLNLFNLMEKILTKSAQKIGFDVCMATSEETNSISGSFEILSLGSFHRLTDSACAQLKLLYQTSIQDCLNPHHKPQHVILTALFITLGIAILFAVVIWLWNRRSGRNRCSLFTSRSAHAPFAARPASALELTSHFADNELQVPQQ